MVAVTIREATKQERADKFPPIVRGGSRAEVPKYVVVPVDGNTIYTVFGLPQGGMTKEEAVFWAERMCSKNGLEFVAPEGWENIEGELPNE